MAAPSFGASAALGADWEIQSADSSLSPTRVTASGDDGDHVASTTHHPVESATIQAIYVGADTAFATAFATLWPGKLLLTNTVLCMGLAIDYAPCAAGKRPMVTFTLRTPVVTLPTTPYWYATTLVLPTYVAANLIVPPILTAVAGDAEIQSCGWSLQCQLGEDLDRAGAFLAGACYAGEEAIDHSWVGVPTSITSTGWDVTTDAPVIVPNASNTDYNVTSYQFVRRVTRASV